MIVKLLQCLILVALIAGADAALIAKDTRRSCALPRAITTNLDRRFPGWELALPNDALLQLVNRDSYSAPETMSLVCEDFDGNGTIDYALHAIVGPSTRETRLIVYLRKGNGYRYLTLERGGRSSGEMLLSVAPRGTRDFDYTNNRKIVYRLPTILFASEKGGYSYVYRRGRFERIVSSD